jgi:glycosyltransferase involved in cell wall biosynthesis
LKGHDVLLRAWAGVAADPEAQGWTLEVWGEGPERAALERLTRDLRIADRVSFRGTVEGAAHRMHELAMVVLPSRREGLPLTLMEAMAAGLPVVASDLPGCREVLGPDAGVFTRPGDPDALRAALLALIADEERRSALGSAGRRRAEEAFSLERMVDSYSRELGVAEGDASAN